MKNRDYKNFAEGQHYHVFNRGNGKQKIFLDDEDYQNFLYLLRESLGLLDSRRAPSALRQGRYQRKQLPENSFTLICYCLMPNHFHLVIRQNREIPVSKLILKICTSYSKRFNKKYDRVGHLFGVQFKAVTVNSDSQLLWLSAYIHQNPKVANISSLNDYQWSSYPDYIGQRQETLCARENILGQFKELKLYQDFVEESYVKIKERKDLEKILLD